MVVFVKRAWSIQGLICVHSFWKELLLKLKLRLNPPVSFELKHTELFPSVFFNPSAPVERITSDTHTKKIK